MATCLFPNVRVDSLSPGRLMSVLKTDTKDALVGRPTRLCSAVRDVVLFEVRETVTDLAPMRQRLIPRIWRMPTRVSTGSSRRQLGTSRLTR